MYTSTTDSLVKSNRSHSTAPTSVEDDASLYSSRSSKRGKLRKEYSESDAGSLGRGFLSRSFRSSKSLTRSRSHSADRSEISDRESEDDVIATVDANDDNLAQQLELAKQNSLNQDGISTPEDIEYEGELVLL